MNAVAVRTERGRVAYYNGLAAEERVATCYNASGARIAERRWRGRYGCEIDLIAREGDTIVFVEVKRARDHRMAAERLSGRQIARIGVAAEEYAATAPDGASASMRFDLALVDAAGDVRILRNACFFD